MAGIGDEIDAHLLGRNGIRPVFEAHQRRIGPQLRIDSRHDRPGSTIPVASISPEPCARMSSSACGWRMARRMSRPSIRSPSSGARCVRDPDDAALDHERGVVERVDQRPLIVAEDRHAGFCSGLVVLGYTQQKDLVVRDGRVPPSGPEGREGPKGGSQHGGPVPLLPMPRCSLVTGCSRRRDEFARNSRRARNRRYCRCYLRRRERSRAGPYSRLRHSPASRSAEMVTRLRTRSRPWVR